MIIGYYGYLRYNIAFRISIEKGMGNDCWKVWVFEM